MKPDISMADALELVKQGRVYRNTATDVFTQLKLSGNPRSTRKGWAIPVSTPSGQKLVPLTDFAAWSHYISDT